MPYLLLLKRFWPYIAGALLLGGVILWHNAKVDAAFKDGAQRQAVADREAFRAAEAAATANQAKIIADTKTKSASISKGTDNALLAENADLARRYDALRVRWEAYRANQGGAGQGGATALSNATAIPDDTYCPSQGWVSLDVAAAAAEAADTAIAKDDAWRAWWAAQEEAWPR